MTVVQVKVDYQDWEALPASRYEEPLEFEFETDVYDAEVVLEEVFAFLNRGSSRERWDLLEGRRSLSVGDRVTVTYPSEEPSRWYCARFGWERLDG